MTWLHFELLSDRFSYQILHKRLVKPIPAGCILRAVIDACHSGSLLGLPQQVSQLECGPDLLV